MRSNRDSGLLDVAQVRFAPLVKWSGNADQDRIHVSQVSEIGCCVETLALDMLADFLRRDMLDVGLSGVQFFNLGPVGVKSGDPMADVRDAQRQRESHVAASDDADPDVLLCKELRFALRAHHDSFRVMGETARPAPLGAASIFELRTIAGFQRAAKRAAAERS